MSEPIHPPPTGSAPTLTLGGWERASSPQTPPPVVIVVLVTLGAAAAAVGCGGLSLPGRDLPSEAGTHHRNMPRRHLADIS